MALSENLSPKEVVQLAEQCVNNFLTRQNADMALMSININPAMISNSNQLQTYYINIIHFLCARGKLKNWLEALADNGIVFVENILNENAADDNEPRKQNKSDKSATTQQLFEIAKLLAQVLYNKDSITIVIQLTNDMSMSDLNFTGIPKNDWYHLLDRANTRVTNRVLELVENALLQDPGHRKLVEAAQKAREIFH